MTASPPILALTEEMPIRRLVADEVLYGQGDNSIVEVAVLVEGVLRVEQDGVALATITMPGAFIGEIGALLGTDRSATVVAGEPPTVRMSGHRDTFSAPPPSLAHELARQLAGRLHRLLAYLGDIRMQYAD